MGGAGGGGVTPAGIVSQWGVRGVRWQGGRWNIGVVAPFVVGCCLNSNST
jgi:hypothetical protein